MDSVTNSEVHACGGRHEIKLGVTFSDTEDPEYNHTVMWGFEPTFAVDSQNPRLDLMYVIHKKYWEELDVEPTKFTEDDGSELVDSYGYFDAPYDPSCVPTTVREKFTELFSEELAEGTFNNPPECPESVDVPNIPEDHSVSVFSMLLQVDGSYTEEVSEEDPRVGDGHFVSEIKDAETGEVLDRGYTISHDMSWWFTPTQDGLKIQKCFHKTWGKRMTRDFKESNPGEKVVESYQGEDKTPSMDSLPADIVADLTDWLGENLVTSSFDQASVPEYVYECFNCGEPSKVTPRDYCPECGSDSLCEFDSLESYRDHIEDRDEEEEQFLDWLCSAEVSTEVEEI